MVATIVEPGCRCGSAALDDPERRVDVRLHRRVEVLVGDVEDRSAALLSSGVHDQDVEAAEPLDRVVDKALAESLVAEVAGERHRHAAFLANELDHFARVRLLLGQVVDRDVGAFAGEGDRGGATHARIAAGDKRLASHEPAGAPIGLSPRGRARGSISLASPGQGCDCRLKGGLGYLSLGSTKPAMAAFGASPWAKAGPAVATARLAPPAPTTSRREKGPRSRALMIKLRSS